MFSACKYQLQTTMDMLEAVALIEERRLCGGDCVRTSDEEWNGEFRRGQVTGRALWTVDRTKQRWTKSYRIWINTSCFRLSRYNCYKSRKPGQFGSILKRPYKLFKNHISFPKFLSNQSNHIFVLRRIFTLSDMKI